MDNANSYVHRLLTCIVQKGDVVVDATVGNGHDTVFLAQLVGNSGIVYGFDVQESAIAITKGLLGDVHADTRIICDGHENMHMHLAQEHHGNVAAVTFNLGYLPGGNKSITTQPSTTLSAMQRAMSLVRIGGVVTVVCYRHSDGELELQAIRDLLTCLPQASWTCMETNFVNQRGNPPVVFIVSKRTLTKVLQ